MKAKLVTKSGSISGDMNLPSQFKEEIRSDLIKRAVLAIQSHKRQQYGADPEAGKKYSSKLSRRRRDYRGAYGMGISRVPRKIMTKRGTRFNWQGATAPNTVGGRPAHPPKAEKIFSRKINKKERRKAIRSALSAPVNKELVMMRGHKVSEYPLVLDDSVEAFAKTKEVLQFLLKIGLKDELVRSERKTEKTGNAKRRGRKFKKAVGPLFVVSKDCPLLKSAKNIPGVDVVVVENLNAELLAPGTDVGRLTLYTRSSVQKIDENKLFTDNPIFPKVEKKKTVKKEKSTKSVKSVKKKNIKKVESKTKKPVKEESKQKKSEVENKEIKK